MCVALVGSLGGWSRDGISDGDKGSSSASCSSTHLTTFAILVDTTGLETVSALPTDRNTGEITLHSIVYL